MTFADAVKDGIIKMDKKPKYKDIHGTTRIGDFLRKVGNSDLIDVALELGTGDVFGALEEIVGYDTNLTQEEKETAIHLIKMDSLNSQEVTKRWVSDNDTDSKLSKNIRPALLLFLTVAAVGIAVVDSVDNVGFSVADKWASLLEMLLITAYAAYFGSRGYEKVSKNRIK